MDPQPHPVTPAAIAPFLAMALAAVRQRAPFQWPAHTTSEGEVGRPPPAAAALFPAFHSSYDWHSCVHSHWTLVRLLRLMPTLPLADEARRQLTVTLTEERLAGELATFERREYQSFERPYGLGWACALDVELRLWGDAPGGKAMQMRLAPFAAMASARILAWHRRLPYPVQSGEHSQSAFGLGLVHDWARGVGDARMACDIEQEITRLYASAAPGCLSAEPSGHDFLSPTLARVELVGRIMDQDDFATWLTKVVPEWTRPAPLALLAPARGHAADDGKLSHLIGLNLSRAWMLRRIARRLPPSDTRFETLTAAAREHAEVGRAAIAPAHFESSHWLGTFAVYGMTDG